MAELLPFEEKICSHRQFELFMCASEAICIISILDFMCAGGFNKPSTYGFLNPLYTGTGGLVHCFMLNEAICHFRSVRSILPL